MEAQTITDDIAESGFTDDWQGERSLAECNQWMLKDRDTCDINFLVGQPEDKVQAHRYILISRSCVFYSMLCGQWSKEDAIKIPDVSKEFFTEFLTFLYTDDCSLTADNVTGLLYLSKKYAVHRLHRLCLAFLKTNVTPDNACVVLEQAHFFDEETLFQQALTIVTTNGNISVMTPGFRDLCRGCLNKVLMSNNFDLYTKPEVVFDGVLSWASAECSRQGKDVTPQNQRNVLGDTVYLVGFTGFDAAVFVQKVVPSKLLAEGEGFKILSNIACPDADVGPFRIVDTKYRPELAILQEIEVYEKFSVPSMDEIQLFTFCQVYDSINIRCDQETTVHGITLAPSESEYEVTVKQANNTIMSTKYTTTSSTTKLNFPFKIRMQPGLTYSITVDHESSKCPYLLLRSMKKSVDNKNKKFYFTPNYIVNKPSEGLIMKIAVS